jgi:hypothetical protein
MGAYSSSHLTPEEIQELEQQTHCQFKSIQANTIILHQFNRVSLTVSMWSVEIYCVFQSVQRRSNNYIIVSRSWIGVERD